MPSPSPLMLHQETLQSIFSDLLRAIHIQREQEKNASNEHQLKLLEKPLTRLCNEPHHLARYALKEVLKRAARYINMSQDVQEQLAATIADKQFDKGRAQYLYLSQITEIRESGRTFSRREIQEIHIRELIAREGDE